MFLSGQQCASTLVQEGKGATSPFSGRQCVQHPHSGRERVTSPSCGQQCEQPPRAGGEGANIAIQWQTVCTAHKCREGGDYIAIQWPKGCTAPECRGGKDYNAIQWSKVCTAPKHRQERGSGTSLNQCFQSRVNIYWLIATSSGFPLLPYHRHLILSPAQLAPPKRRVSRVKFPPAALPTAWWTHHTSRVQGKARTFPRDFALLQHRQTRDLDPAHPLL